MGDWYAQKMYQFGGADYKFQCANYGHPSKMGFKDVIHSWKAEDWDPATSHFTLQTRGRKIFRGAGASPRQLRQFRLDVSAVEQRRHRAEEGHGRRLGEGGARRRFAAGGDEPRRPRVELVSGRARFRSERPAGRRALRRIDDARQTARDFGGKASTRRIFTRSITRLENTPGRRAKIRRWQNRSSKNISTASLTCIDKYHPDLLYFDDSDPADLSLDRHRPAHRRLFLQHQPQAQRQTRSGDRRPRA